MKISAASLFSLTEIEQWRSNTNYGWSVMAALSSDPAAMGLLKAIEECHSLNAAAKKLKMSYRAAWGRIRASEERLGIKLVEMDSVKHGMHLTNEAKELMDCFDQLEQDIARLLNKANGKLPLRRS